MREILYIKIERNVVVQKPEVVLKDIAKITCTNSSIVNKLKTIKVFCFPRNSRRKKGQIEVFSILKIIQLIGQEYPGLEIQNMGEMDFLVEYIPSSESKWMGILKALVICVLVFFGSAFTIMTFNNDVGVSEVFLKFYQQVMGRTSDGFTSLEVCYAIGLALGIVIFFNHLGKKKLTHDPTPIQVQMRKYEQEVDTTFIENSSRKGTSNDVD